MSHLIGDYVKKFPANPPSDKEAATEYWNQRMNAADSWGHLSSFDQATMEAQGRRGEEPRVPGTVQNKPLLTKKQIEDSNPFKPIFGLKDSILEWFKEVGKTALWWVGGAVLVLLLLWLVFKKAEKVVLNE